MHSLELKIPPVALGLVLGVLMGVVAWSVPILEFTLPAGRIVAAGVATAGVIVALLGVVSFRRARTTVNPLRPESSSALVVAGIYRLTRNPMYLGMLLVLLGWAVFLGHTLALVMAASFIPLMDRLQIGPEERILSAKFGAEFTVYQSAVRRWL